MTEPLLSGWRSVKSHGGLFLIAFLAIIAFAGLAYPGVPIDRLVLLVPTAYVLYVLGDAATVFVLLATWRWSLQRRSTLLLAISFAVSAALSLLATLTLPLVPHVVTVIDASSNSALWLYVFWHVSAALGALTYVGSRANDAGESPSRRFIAGAIALAAGVTVVCGIVAFKFTGYLPHLDHGNSLAGLLVSGVGPITVALLAVAAFLTFRIPHPTTIDRALALSLVALSLDTLQLVVGHERYTRSFYAGRVLLLLGGMFVLVSAVRSLLNSQVHAREVETALVVAERESATRAGRIRALWEMASHQAQSDEERSRRILEIAANALRPSKSMRGYLAHLEGQTLVVDATSWVPADAPADLAEIVFSGAALPIDRTILSLVGPADHTLAWDDLEVIERRGMLWENLGWNSAIASSVTVSGRVHYVLFFSHERMADQPFAQDDIAYVDVVTSFFANRFTQQMQFDELQFAVEHDALTGLANRVQFRQAIRDDIRSGRPFTIAFANIDDFRRLNEREGHSIGDEVLVEVAEALTSVSSADLVARMSGDEFGLILRGFGTVDQAAEGIERYAGVFRTAFHGGALEESHTIFVGASFGAARFPDDGKTGEDLMRRAGVALDVAKTRGGSTIMIFDEPMQMILDDQRLRVAELADAAEHDHFALVYQPTFALATRKITGAEALIRWDHPECGRLAPSEFIPFAERNGMIGSISRWVLHRLMNDISHVALPPGFRVYFNLAAEMLDDIPFIAELSEALRVVPQLIDHLGIEVTETAAMQNVERSMHTIDLLRRWGFSVAIDDFGTGYSSLSYLKRLTVDMIKIDRSFVIGLPYDERDAALTEMLLRITDRFGFATLAEGIETEAQATWLAEKGCGFGQGYLVAKPGTFEELMERIGVSATAA